MNNKGADQPMHLLASEQICLPLSDQKPKEGISHEEALLSEGLDNVCPDNKQNLGSDCIVIQVLLGHQRHSLFVWNMKTIHTAWLQQQIDKTGIFTVHTTTTSYIDTGQPVQIKPCSKEICSSCNSSFQNHVTQFNKSCDMTA